MDSKSGGGVENMVKSPACESARILDRALASAWVFPGSSLEYPAARITGVSASDGHRATSMHPTQKAVGIGVHFSASERARRRKWRCSAKKIKLRK
jgi:hypothetical protein